MNWLMSYNYARARKYGADFSLVSWLINQVSDDTHSELQFDKLWNCVSFSCTNADGAGCCRFKMIGYSNGLAYWDRDEIPCTPEKQLQRIVKACELADVSLKQLQNWLKTAKHGDLLYGKNAVKYDLIGTALSFISRLDIVKSSRTKMRCNEACTVVIQASDALEIDPETSTPSDLRQAVRNKWS